jgi:hypothetical protein
MRVDVIRRAQLDNKAKQTREKTRRQSSGGISYLLQNYGSARGFNDDSSEQMLLEMDIRKIGISLQ